MSYWLISVPNQGQTEKAVFDKCNSATKPLSTNHLFRVPQLKVGTLDTLMALSDDLAKYDTAVGQIAKKIERTYFDLSKSDDDKKPDTKDKDAAAASGAKQAAESESLKIGNVTAREFVEKFSWNETRYPKRSPLRTLTDLIVKEANKSDEALKKQVAEYNEIRQTYAGIERRDTGSLLVKSLAPYIKEKDIIEKGHLTSLVIVLPRAKIEEFEASYETMEEAQREKEEAERKRKQEEAKQRTEELARKKKELAEAKVAHDDEAEAEAEHDAEEKENDINVSNLSRFQEEKENDRKARRLPPRIVVPRSAKKLFDDGKDEFVLYRIVVLREGQSLIQTICRERRYTIRPYKFDPVEEKAEHEKKAELLKKRKALWSYLLRWCQTTYAEIFASWIHLKTIRLFVESVLRYGLPVSFTAILLEPVPKRDTKLRQELKSLYGKLAGSNMAAMGASNENEPDISGLTSGEFYPYVYLPLTLVD